MNIISVNLTGKINEIEQNIQKQYAYKQPQISSVEITTESPISYYLDIYLKQNSGSLFCKICRDTTLLLSTTLQRLTITPNGQAIHTRVLAVLKQQAQEGTAKTMNIIFLPCEKVKLGLECIGVVEIGL